ncbi:unnamed protein product [Fraxinus pennsylvanica]|uniref:F-box domain-containing protein n=1 Tax=Fraxinus pennsylvanica TaxID=56036 RepID=A0AAD2DR57_9LAMI|nr:unnamed protein product [Fraxinus pennsylvanica]
MSDEGFLMNLSLHIIVDILSILPAATIISCKFVCKKWLGLISIHEFGKSHLSRSNLASLSSNTRQLHPGEFVDYLNLKIILNVGSTSINGLVCQCNVCREYTIHMVSHDKYEVVYACARILQILICDMGYEGIWSEEIMYQRIFFFISKMPEFAGISYEMVYALKVFENGDILMSWEDYLFFYRNQSKTLQQVEVVPNYSIQTMLHVPSFVSLKNFTENIRVF